MKTLFAVALAVTAMAWPAMAQTNKSNEGIQSPTQQQRLDNGTVIPHGAHGSQTVHEGYNSSGRVVHQRHRRHHVRHD
jgi:hypothetical protein